MGLPTAEKFEAIQLPLMQELIRHHPTYGSVSQHACAQLIHNALADNGWSSSIIDKYTAFELAGEPDYVPVGEFGADYEGDADRTKSNVYGVVDSGTEGPTIILNGHYDVDVVSDPHSWGALGGWKSGLVADGNIFGRGATDMLGGLTSLIAVGSYFAEIKDEWKGRIVLCAVTDEEIGGNGTVQSFRALERLGYLASTDIVGLIAEPTSGIIADESLGFMHMKLVANRKSQHMGTAQRTNNSLYDMIDVITNFDEIAGAAVDSMAGRTDSSLIHNFGIINGGQDAAIPIGEVHSEATIFYPANIAKSGLEKAIDAQLRQRFGSVIAAEFSDFGFRGHKSPDSQFGSILQATSTSESVTRGSFKSPCDARIFSTYGVPDVTIFGPGMLEDAHSIDERIELGLLQNYNQHLVRAISEVLKK
jgi:acetylornithine deacetylase